MNNSATYWAGQVKKWSDSVKQAKSALKDCQPQNERCFGKAVKFAQVRLIQANRALRLLKCNAGILLNQEQEMKNIIVEVIRAAVILGIVFILSGCSTIAGLGTDITDCANSSRVAMRDYAAK